MDKIPFDGEAFLAAVKLGKRSEYMKYDLCGANLIGADFRWADLRGADFCGASFRGANLRGAILRGANLSWADFHEANLLRVDFKGADLRGADLDYSSLPLWCGSLNIKVDKRIAAQIAYHFCSLDCDDAGYIKARNAVIDFDNQFHRASEYGFLQKKEETANEQI